MPNHDSTACNWLGWPGVPTAARSNEHSSRSPGRTGSPHFRPSPQQLNARNIIFIQFSLLERHSHRGGGGGMDMCSLDPPKNLRQWGAAVLCSGGTCARHPTARTAVAEACGTIELIQVVNDKRAFTPRLMYIQNDLDFQQTQA